MKVLLRVLFALSLSSVVVNSLKILFISPSVKAPGHYRMLTSLTRRLCFKGHDVTVVSPFFEKLLPENVAYRDLLLNDFYENTQAQIDKLNYDALSNLNAFETIRYVSDENFRLTEKVLRHESLQKIIKNGEKFDLVVVTEYGLHALKALAPFFGAPLVIFAPEGPNIWINDFIGNPLPLAYVPDHYLKFSGALSIKDRAWNAALYIYQRLNSWWYDFPRHQRLVDKYIVGRQKGEMAPLELSAILYNVSLVLSNSHPVVTQSIPAVPNLVEIGGFHIGPLAIVSMDVQQFVDGAPEGAILFHMGVNLKTTNYPRAKFEAVVNTFSRLNQRVLWRFDSTNNSELGIPSENVMLRRWVPTSEILARETVELLITAGDSKSIMEAVHHGVPVLVIQLFGEPSINSRFVVENGYGLALDFQDLTEENFRQTIKRLLNSKKYGRKAQEVSTIFQDRLQPAMNETIYWIEYIGNNSGAPHLRVAGVDLPFYKYWLLDVLALSGLVVFISWALLCHVTCKLCAFVNYKRGVRRNKSKKE